MKLISKKILFALMLFLLSAVFSNANAVVVRDAKKPAVDAAKSAAKENSATSSAKLACDKFINLLPKVDQRVSDFNVKLKEKRDERLKNLETSRDKRDEALKNARLRWEENRQEQFRALESKAQTDAQKQAVLKFRNEAASAIKTRQQAVDAAIEAYRDGIDKIISDRKASVDTAKTTLRNAIKAATDKAKADCSAGVDAKTVRDNLHASLKAAREKYVSDVQALEKNRLQAMQQILAARKEAIKKALDDFKATMEKLRSELKAAFGQTADNTTAP